MVFEENQDEHSLSAEIPEPLTIVQLCDLIGIYIENEKVLEDQLNKFSCERNLDVQNFLQRKALQFEKTHKSRTYLALDEATLTGESTELDVIGYFTLSLKHLNLGTAISKTKQKELNGLFLPQGNVVVGYLIGQLGKNDAYCKEQIGSRLLNAALGILQGQAQRAVGGRFVIIECNPDEKLINFYQRNGFYLLQVDPKDGMAQLVCRIP